MNGRLYQLRVERIQKHTLLIHLLLLLEALVDYKPDVYAATLQRCHDIVIDFLNLCRQLLDLGANDVLHLLALCFYLSFQDGLGVGEHLDCLDLVT